MTQRRYRAGETIASVEAPLEILTVLDRTLGPHATQPGDFIAVHVSVGTNAGGWIVSAGDSTLALPTSSEPPTIAGAVTTVMAREVARVTSRELLEAVVVEHDQRALAFVGPGWSAAVTIATHLSLRGWRILTTRYAFLEPETMVIHGLTKLLSIEINRISDLPLQYRRALEASPWHSTSGGIAFYGVDPRLADGRAGWAEHATLRAALVVRTGSADATPKLDLINGELTTGSVMATVNAVEHWFEDQLAPA